MKKAISLLLFVALLFSYLSILTFNALAVENTSVEITELHTLESSRFLGSVSSTKIIVGDVDGDGNVTPTDRMILARYIAKWDGYESMCNLKAADIDGDGNVTPTDRMILARYIAKWEGYEKYFVDKTGSGIELPLDVF